MEQSLEAQVRSEVERYALTEGVLRRLVKERGKVFSDDGARAAIDSLCTYIVEDKGKSFTTHYALRETAEVSAEEASANMKRLERGLVKNADKRREFYLR